MTHAMIFTGVNVDESKQPKIIKGWEVENSCLNLDQIKDIII